MNARDRRLWLVGIYGCLLVPFIGAAVLIVTSSVVYCAKRRTDPQLARFVNRHAWMAIGLNTAANVAVLLLTRR